MPPCGGIKITKDMAVKDSNFKKYIDLKGRERYKFYQGLPFEERYELLQIIRANALLFERLREEEEEEEEEEEWEPGEHWG